MNIDNIANWSSILSLVFSIISLYLIGSVRKSVIIFRRKGRLRQLLSEIKSIPNDAVPLSPASKSKLNSLSRNLPGGYLPFWWSSQNKTIRDIRAAIKSEDIAAIKDGIEDYISFFEDI